MSAPGPPTGQSRGDEEKRAAYCSSLPLKTVRACLDNEHCQAVVWNSAGGSLARHVRDFRVGPTVCCEPVQEAKKPDSGKHSRLLRLESASREAHGGEFFAMSKSSPCLKTVCNDGGLQDWCEMKPANLCMHLPDDPRVKQSKLFIPPRCKSLELFADQPTSNIKAHATLSVPGLQEALELETNLARLDTIVQRGYDLYNAALTEADRDIACGLLSRGHTDLQHVRESDDLFVGKYIGFDEHWFYGNPNYFKDIGDNIADIAGINVMVHQLDVGFMSTTNLQTVTVIAWGAILDGIIDMYRQYESGKQAARQMIPKVMQTCNLMDCLVQQDSRRTYVPVIKPLFDERLGEVPCTPCKPFAFCKAAGGSCDDLQKAVGIISSACDIVFPRKGYNMSASWETIRSVALRKVGGDFCFAEGYFPGASEVRGGRLSDLLGKAVEAFWKRIRFDFVPDTDIANKENAKVIDAANAALRKAKEQCAS